MDSARVSSKILGTTEYRQLNEIERAVKFGKEAGISYLRAGKAAGVSKDAVWRGARAQAQGRDIGVKGRPGKLNKKEMEEFIGLVRQKLADHEEVDYEQAAELAKAVWIKHNADNLHFGPPNFNSKWLLYHFKRHGISAVNCDRIVEPVREVAAPVSEVKSSHQQEQACGSKRPRDTLAEENGNPNEKKQVL